jgi:bifunctional non-homologous end joining protein LigD
MARSAATQRDTSIQTYRSKRDFTTTREPAPADRPKSRRAQAKTDSPIFVVQKHRAHRAGLHWDFRLQHNDVLWSWAVPKGPSLDPADKRIAIHVEDHPIDYAQFQGSIPEGSYGEGSVETWDRGTWEPLLDPDQGLRDGEIKFVLHGERLNGKFTLVRLKPKPKQRGRQDNWLLIKGHDADERSGADAAALEAATDLSGPPAKPPRDGSGKRPRGAKTPAAGASADPPPRDAPAKSGKLRRAAIPGAVRGKLPETQAPQLASVAENPPDAGDWLTEIKFDGYRLLAFLDHGKVRILTRNGIDWTSRLPAMAQALGRMPVDAALLDGELVALDKDGISSFPALQAALADGQEQALCYYLFDLLHLDGWDLRRCTLRDRKERLRTLDRWQGMLRYSDHHEGDTAAMRKAACRMKLEGIICKRADAPYRTGRGQDWLKVKCRGREEFLVLGWTEPEGKRTGLGALHLGYYDPDGQLHYAGGVGTGFSDDTLELLRNRLDGLASKPPHRLMIAGDDLEPTIHWVRPELVVETNFTGWSGAGRVRHAVYLGLREDKAPTDVRREPADPDVGRRAIAARDYAGPMPRGGPILTLPAKRKGRDKAKGDAVPSRGPNPPARSQRAVPSRTRSAIVTARPPKARTETVEGVTLTHPDRGLWPGITKRDLALYWQAVADHALPGIARRPLAILRCPEGIDGEHFFQKHGHGAMPPGIREGVAEKAPYLVIDGLQGLIAMAQLSAIELHAWGATESDPLHADQLVFDLDPGDGVKVPEIAAAALDMRDRLQAIGLASFCRTSGGKGLHVVVPLIPKSSWDQVRVFCKAFAESVSAAAPDKYLAHVKIADRNGRILIDWLRNGLGSTAVASFCPRARTGAGVATPLAWNEVNAQLDLSSFTLRKVPDRLAKLRADPWADFENARCQLPNPPSDMASETQPKARAARKATIVTAKAPKPRSGKT